MKIDYNYLKENNFILYEVISGSIAYGTNLPSSDEDRRYVYILPIDYILSGNIIEQVNDDTNDVVGYELGRFLNLLSSANPNLLELLNMPEDCVVYKNPAFDIILENKDKFLTKKCKNSFAGYAHSQISKAKGQDKKQNWEKDKVTRKDVLDFVYVIEGEKSIPWKKWNTDSECPSGKIYDEKFCGVVNIPNARDLYAVYFDSNAEYCFSDRISQERREEFISIMKEEYKTMGFGYKGLVKTGEGANVAESNQLRLSSIPKGQTPICNIIYNKDGYTMHCKDYKEYQEWLDNRNEARWVDVQSHGQKIDGKNLLHLVRLLKMSREIIEGKGIIVRRKDSDELLKIRRGEVNLESIINWSKEEIDKIDFLFRDSNLPDRVDSDFINKLIINIRKKIYKL
jgi:hypothetical protein